MRTCSKCKLTLDISMFNKIGNNRDGSKRIQNYCKSCKKKIWDKYYLNKDNRTNHQKRLSKQSREKRVELRRFVNSLKDVPCKDCGNKYPPWVMDFDHLRDKYEDVSKMIANKRPKEVILEEVKKCDIICSNCHRDRTYKRRLDKYEI